MQALIDLIVGGADAAADALGNPLGFDPVDDTETEAMSAEEDAAAALMEMLGGGAPVGTVYMPPSGGASGGGASGIGGIVGGIGSALPGPAGTVARIVQAAIASGAGPQVVDALRRALGLGRTREQLQPVDLRQQSAVLAEHAPKLYEAVALYLADAEQPYGIEKEEGQLLWFAFNLVQAGSPIPTMQEQRAGTTAFLARGY